MSLQRFQPITTPPRVLLTGDDGHSDFQAVVDWLNRHCQVTRRPIHEAAQWLTDSGCPPRLIVIGKSRPEKFSSFLIDQFHRAAPLAHMIALLGSWCDRESHSSALWPGVHHVPWHQAIARFSQQFPCGTWDPVTEWSLPRTATGVERLLHWAQHARRSQKASVAVTGRNALTVSCVVDACEAVGFEARIVRDPLRDSLDCSAVLCHMSTRDPGWKDELRPIIQRARPAPVVLLIDFLRRFEQIEAEQIGAAAALSLPLRLNDLNWSLNELTAAIRDRKHPAA